MKISTLLESSYEADKYKIWKSEKRNFSGIVLIRMGDFYETFDKDAETVSKVLKLTVTKSRLERYPMCGIPAKAIKQYEQILNKNNIKYKLM